MSFTIGSLFDGSGGFPLAAFMCGGEPVWASEIEPYPIAVTRTRFPHMKHLGSVTDIRGNEVTPVDVISFGSPCQDLSIAGKRAGLKHEDNGDDETTRSGLFMEAVRIIKEMREATHGVYPRFALWENVPGAFSSNKGEDFRIVLEELIKIVEPGAVMPPVPKNGWPYSDSYCGDGWSLAYRVFDAQYWGVPQRRRRIYLVLDLGGECAGEVSFKRDGLRGYFAQGRTPWQTTPCDAERGSGTADSEAIGINGEVAATLDASYYKGCGMRQGIEREVVATPVCYSLDPLSSNSMKSSNPHSGCHMTEVARTIDTTDPNPSKNQGGLYILEPRYCGNFLPQKKAEGMAWSTEDVSCTLYNGACAGYQNAVVEGVPYLLKIRSGCEGGGKGALVQEDKSATLSTLNDQYLFQPVIDAHILDDQGGSQISVRQDGKCPTLRAEMHGNIPCVLESAGFKAGNGSKARGIGWEDETSPTLASEAGGNSVPSVCCKYMALAYDARSNGDGATVPTITGDHNNRVTDYTCLCCEPTVAYGIGNGQVNQPLMEEKVGALNCMHDQQAVCYGVDCRNATEYPELNGTLQAKPGGGTSLNCNQVVRIQYIVRRLTPTECARLQGFADGWAVPDKKTEFTDEEYAFWLNVRNTHAEINGKPVKSYTRDQMLTWYNKLHTDSSEYKLWGNGIALPCALYMMQGISDVFK